MNTFTVSDAERIARGCHAGQLDLQGVPYIHHVESVVAGVRTDDEKIVAWLHDTVEDKLITIEELRALGLAGKLEVALLLVTRDPDRHTYRQFITLICDADGEPGAIARAVKLADLRHNQSRPQPAGREDIVRKRYAPATQRIIEAMTYRGESVSYA